jgi:protease I
VVTPTRGTNARTSRSLKTAGAMVRMFTALYCPSNQEANRRYELTGTIFLERQPNIVKLKHKQKMANLKDLKVAILSENGFEQAELVSPKQKMEEAGVTVHVVSPQANELRAWDEKDWGITISVDKKLDEANPDDYDGLMLPGGVLNPDKLRMNQKAIDFIGHFLEAGKPLGVICHGPQTMIETGMLRGRTMTSYPSIKTDLINAGVTWVDREVVVDNGLVSSRSPKDLDAFNRKLLEELAEGVHALH